MLLVAQTAISEVSHVTFGLLKRVSCIWRELVPGRSHGFAAAPLLQYLDFEPVMHAT